MFATLFFCTCHPAILQELFIMDVTGFAENILRNSLL